MGGVAALLHGEGAGGDPADGGGDRPDRRFRAGRGLREGRRALRGGRARPADRRDHGDQRLEPVRGDRTADPGPLHARRRQALNGGRRLRTYAGGRPRQQSLSGAPSYGSGSGRRPDSGQIRPSSRTASRSSVSSCTDASMRARENSLMSRPWTISYFPSFVVTGKEEMMPSGTP